MIRVAVVGAGPAGSYLAYLLAKQGAIVDLYDRKDVYDSPCGEVIPTPHVAYWGYNNKVWNELEKAIEDAKLNEITTGKWAFFNEVGLLEKSFTLKLSAYSIDKPRFVSNLRRMAEKAGARFVRMEVDPKKIARDYDIVFDARGPHTDVPGKRMMVMRSYTVTTSTDFDTIYIYTYEPMFGYAWAFPHGGRENVGSGCLGCDPALVKWSFEHILYDLSGDRISALRTMKWWAILATRPREQGYVYNGKPIIRVGEAAGHVTYITGEGIRPALLSASVTAAAVNNALHVNSISVDWRRKPQKLLRYVNSYVAKTRVARDTATAYDALRLVSKVVEKNPSRMYKLLKHMPKRVYLKLFGGELETLLKPLVKILSWV